MMTHRRNFDVTLLNYVTQRTTPLVNSRYRNPIKCAYQLGENIRWEQRDSPLSCHRACRGSWYPEAAETRRRAIRSCTSALAPNARSKLALCSCSCACPADASPWICGLARPDHPPDRSAPPNATEI